MSEWRPIAEAPRDCPILGWGRVIVLDHDDVVTPTTSRRAVIYWDEIDEAWCVSTHPWCGPFFEPTLWQPLPPPPSSGEG
ncbi:MAG: hypothetical protein KGL39_51980 [Patescibacteria group bacterium]|nr:hypothetical protein [Patescibacteria group bacterium]